MAGNPERELRNEARFRLALMLADRLSRPRDAAVLLRQILDETPDAARVRLELARMQAMLGNLGSAAREMRAAQAGGLPPDVERMVRFYAAALADARPFGAQVEVALAPDSNINRATRADTLSTIIGDFSLSDDARARSGTGLALRGQAFARRRLNPAADLMLRASASANLYAAREFDDVIVALQAGPDLKRGRDRIAFGVGPSWRWYGMQPYSATLGATLDWQHPLGSRAQAKLALGAGRVTNRRNPLQSGPTYSAALSLDRAIDARSGVGAQLAASRDGARDPAYALTGGSATLFAFREFGPTTAVATASYGHLEADAALFLLGARRVDDRFSLSLAGTFRSLRIGSFAPFVRLRFERNLSNTELYDYRRVAGELGIATAF